LPTSPSFFFLFFFNDNTGEWMVARCRYLPSRIRSFDHRGRRMECPSALPRIRRCGTVHADYFSFRYEPASQLHGKPARIGVNLTLRWQNERMDVHREWITSAARWEAHEAEVAQEVLRSLTRPTMHVSAKCDNRC